MASTIYGIISDIHEHPEHVGPAIDRLIELGAQKLILNGDLANDQGNIRLSRQRFENTLETIAQKGLPTTYHAGGHERMPTIISIGRKLEQKYSNLTCSLYNPVVHGDNHDLFFIPGSGTVGNGEFEITTQHKTGPYFLIPTAKKDTFKLNPFPEDEPIEDELLNIMHNGQVIARYFFNPNDYKHHIRDPNKTIVFCHDPIKSSSTEYGVDCAKFGSYRGKVIPIPTVLQIALQSFAQNNNRQPTKQDLFQEIENLGIQLQIDNVGNEELTQFYQQLGITKAINGHIHEAGHRAHTSQDVPLQENEWTSNLFWNSGCLDNNQCGLLEVDGANVRYRNILINQTQNFALNLPPIQQSGAPTSRIILPQQEPRTQPTQNQPPTPGQSSIILPGQISTDELTRYQKR